jgi:uncharacterized membrane protein YgaE (UPF0421/DUF939 family)
VPARLDGLKRSDLRPLLLDRAAALRMAAPRILLAAIAAGVAWFIANDVLDNEQPFFAPIAAVLTLGLAVDRRGARAWELALGVALGIGVADLIVLATGTGAWQLVLVVCLAMAVAVLAGGGVLLVNQAAISAVLVTTLQMPQGSYSGERFVDALVGCGVALIVNALVPVNPVRLVLRQIEPLLARLSGTLVDIADALATGDHDAAQEALERARDLDPAVRQLQIAVGAGRETTQIAPTRRGSRGRVEGLAAAAHSVDLAIRNTRVLARAARRAIELDDHIPELATEAIRDLAAATRALDRHLADPKPDSLAVDAALRAAARATATLEQTGNLSVNVIVGQVRATATDLLRGLGLSSDEAIARVRSARVGLEI